MPLTSTYAVRGAVPGRRRPLCVRGARRHELWRVAHPYDPDVAVRIICWFPANDQIVLALVGFDKKSIGDVFYASAAARGEAIVDAWLRQKGNSHD
jgi:hypothetical protein